MSTVARKVLKRLREERSELLNEAPKREVKEYDLGALDPDMPPSEMKKLTDQIKRKRLTASGLSQEEAKALLRRLGHR